MRVLEFLTELRNTEISLGTLLKRYSAAGAPSNFKSSQTLTGIIFDVINFQYSYSKETLLKMFLWEFSKTFQTANFLNIP